MHQSNGTKEHIEQFSLEALDVFKQVAEAAEKALRDQSEAGVDSLVSVNTMTSTAAIDNLERINQANRENYKKLMFEPAIARIVVVDEDGCERTYYICRATPVPGVDGLASYLAPIGRLASLPIGSDFVLPNGSVVEVVEQAELHPRIIDRDWDSENTKIEGESFGPVTIKSLRAILKGTSTPDLEEDLLEKLLLEESQSSNIIEGVRRSVITKMGLRDQPILDQYQDEIFRLPLNKRLLILGPPGTGKTTTLIRRLGQKINPMFLDEDERRLVDNLEQASTTSHFDSWIMFTPTDLLRQYLKEAFSREGVPASDQRIRTWSDYRRQLGRNTFGILKTASGRGAFVLRESVDSLVSDATDNMIGWFSDFYEWQKNSFIEDLKLAAEELHKDENADVSRIGGRLAVATSNADSATLDQLFISLVAEVNEVRELVTAIRRDTDKIIKRSLNLQLNKNRGFIDDLKEFIDKSLQAQNDGGEDQEELEGYEEESSFPRTERAAAVTAYMQAIRALARARARKRHVGKDSRNGQIIQWLGDRVLEDKDLANIGKSLLVQGRARRFISPVKEPLINSLILR